MKKKANMLQVGLSMAALLLFAVFVWNLENMLRELPLQGRYVAEVTTLDYYLENGRYAELLDEVREQQLLGMETYLDRSEYDVFADYYEASLRQAACLAGEAEEQREAAVWQEKREAAEKKLTAYRFRKAAQRVREVFP